MGYSAVVMRVTRRAISGRSSVAAESHGGLGEDLEELSTIACAKSDQEAPPPAVMWKVPPLSARETARSPREARDTRIWVVALAMSRAHVGAPS